jgi:hypothetical protein
VLEISAASGEVNLECHTRVSSESLWNAIHDSDSEYQRKESKLCFPMSIVLRVHKYFKLEFVLLSFPYTPAVIQLLIYTPGCLKESFFDDLRTCASSRHDRLGLGA